VIVSAIKCNKCKDTIYSRARHDFRSCTCGAVAIDGGRDYTKVSGSEFTSLDLDLGELTAAQLYQDWNKRIDKLGLIKEKRKKK
jgi:hypothetical protein